MAAEKYTSHLPHITGQQVRRGEISIPISDRTRGTIVLLAPGVARVVSPFSGSVEKPANNIVMETQKPLSSATIAPDEQAKAS